MNIIQQPDALSLSQNLKDFLITSDVQISFVLKQGGVEVLSQRYDPPKEGTIVISLRDVVHERLSYTLKDSGIVYQQFSLVDNFTAVIDSTEVTFRVIRSGVDRLADSATNFLSQNFLTWQPSIKPVTYYSPEFLTYYAVVHGTVKLRAYFTNDAGAVTSQTDYTITDLLPGIAYTIPLQYSVVAGWLGHKLPAYYDVWVENPSGQRLTYIQRYYAEDMRSEQEQWILFENSLGGLDTFRAYGNTTFNGEHTHNLAEIDEISQEYRIDTERKFQKNTGHLNNDERKWLLDFFPSKGKFCYTGNYLRPIVVVESNVSYSDKELPSNYTFTFKFADARPLLNLPRTDVPADVLNITVPSVGSFTVPPRLAEFSRLPLSEGALFPIQNPYSEEWATTTTEAIGNFLAEFISQYYGSGGGIGHQHRNFDLLQLLSFIEGYLLVNGQKIKAGYADKAKFVDGMDEIFLHRKKEDIASEIITFLKGLLIGKNGSGITVLENGKSQAVVDYLYVKVKAIFDELEVKKKTYVGGEQILSPVGMKCIKVEELDDAYRCYFKAEEDGVEIENQFTVGTFAIAQENNIKVGVSHHSGNRYYWRAVTAVGADYIDLSKTKCAPNIENDIPAAGDDIVGLGHDTDITRQGAIILSSVNEVAPSILMYQGIDSFSLAGKDVIGFDYDKATGKARMRVYGDTYIGAKDRNSFIELVDGKLRIKAKVDILPDSTGLENVGGIEFGKINLLRNSGFTGDYNSAKLEDDTELEAETDLYSQALKYWAATNAIVNVDTISRSGRSVTLNTGILVQTLYYKMIESEKYIISYKAKGTSVSISCGGLEKTEQLSSSYQKFVYKFDAAPDTEITISGTCTICELQLECGTVPSEWSMSPLDNNSMEAKIEALRYLTDVIKNGSTSFIGGLGLMSMLKLGNYVDGQMKKETAGISGVYNDDDDVAFWAGGNYEQAVRAVLEYLDNPNRELDEGTLAEIAKVVITHGGRAILNDVILRGYIYAVGGIFKGKITQGNGRNVMNEDGSVSFCNGKIRWGEDGNPVIEGKFTTSFDGKRIEIDSESNSLKMYNQENMEVASFMFIESTIEGKTDYIPRLRMRRFVGDTLYDETRISTGSIWTQIKRSTGDVYSVNINPEVGMVFLKNNQETKRYPCT